jgi:hypothetical protein
MGIAMPLRLTDSQLDVVRAFAEPIHITDRDAFLQRVAALLRDVEIGDGAVHRACEKAQLEYRRPTASINGRVMAGKYA